MSQLIFTYTTPVDPGGGNPERDYFSVPIGAGWTALSMTVTTDATHAWSGSGRIDPGQHTTTTFNTLLPANSTNTYADPNQAYVTTSGDEIFITCNNGGGGAVLTVQLFGIQTGPCSVGSEPQVGAPAFFTYAQGDLATVLPGNIGLILWGILGIPTAPQATADFCSAPPPTDLPTAADFVKLAFPPAALATGTYKRFANQVVADKWNALCQCIPPGSYTPPAPPSPPAGFPALPAGPTCASYQDVCNELQVIYQTLQYLLQLQASAQPQQIHSLGEFTIHSALSGDGIINLGSSTIGVKVQITTDSPIFGSSDGSPVYLFDRGYIVPLTVEGPIRGFTRFVYNPQLFLLPPLTTQVGYHFGAGVVAKITELTAGP